MISLPGGIETDGALRTDVVLRPMSGAVEMALAEVTRSSASQPAKVSRFLAETLLEVGGQPCDENVAGQLCVADRQYLVRQVGVSMGRDLIWLTGTCNACGESFDVPVEQSALPTKKASSDFPAVEVRLADRSVTVRSPTGSDQHAISHLPVDKARDILLRRLAGLEGEADVSSDEEAQIESAIEALSPEVTTEIGSACPACAAEQRIAVDPYAALAGHGGDILQDVHVLASKYHWPEADILALPRARRKAYLAMIDAARGIHVQSDPPFGAT
ncbi:MAG: hypothetical protein AB8B58_05745 [Roseobacter sp.]